MSEGIETFELTPLGEISSRVNKLQKKMQEKGVDLALIIQNADLFYFTGAIQRGYLFVPLEEEPIFFVQKDYERAIRESPLRCIRTEGLKALPSLLHEYGLEGKKIGMELDVVPVSLFYKIKGLFKRWEFLDISEDVKEVRSIKSTFEIRQIKRSGQIVDYVFSEVRRYLREGMSELELDGILTSIGRAKGHQGFLRMRGFNQEMMNIHVLSGGSACMASFCDTPLGGYGVTHAIAQGSSAKRIKRDEPIIIDYGGGYNGYVTDETRVFVIGRLKGHLERAYQVAQDIIEDMESFAREGVQAVQIYKRAQEIAAKEDLTQHFMGHGEGRVAFVGHGLGLEINEWPIIGRGGEMPLQVGMVFAFEPKFVFPGEGAVGIEMDYIVREDGLERVTHFPREIVSL
ncbi:MAG: aminopeptidase P family protein [Deltaproteobacteria bacterium]|nr:aminopeptidase P family protein [Deltaproteobacteria bacterium]